MTTEPGQEPNRLVIGGLLALGVTGAMQLIDKPPSASLVAASYAFAAGVPLLAFGLVAELKRVGRGRVDHSPAWVELVTLGGMMAVVAGLVACFCHIGYCQGGIFGGLSALALVLIRFR